jgi:hypothetical protein
MNDAAAQPLRFHPPRAESDLARRLRGAVAGDVLFDSTSRGRYATDASIYQVEPIGVLVPRSAEDVRTAIAICREQNVPMLPRGAGSSQCGQTVGAALVIDHSKHLNRIGRFDPDAMTVDVEPVVLDQLNTYLCRRSWVSVDVSTSAQATLSGMAGSNSCGSRRSPTALNTTCSQSTPSCPADGSATSSAMIAAAPRVAALVRDLAVIGARGATRSNARCRSCCAASAAATSTFTRRAAPLHGGWRRQLRASPCRGEGTLAWTRGLTLKPRRCPRIAPRCRQFPTLFRAMECAQHLVRLGPSVELVDGR